MTLKDLAKLIDISSVRTDVTLCEIDEMIRIAKRYRLICAFAMPSFTSYLIEQLKEEPDILVGGVVGFPSGADTTSMKIETAKELITMGWV